AGHGAGLAMPTLPDHGPVSASSDSAARQRLHIHGIEEMPAGYDAEVAELFRDLRSASSLSESDLAARLSTRVEVVQALEQGALYALPPGPRPAGWSTATARCSISTSDRCSAASMRSSRRGSSSLNRSRSPKSRPWRRPNPSISAPDRTDSVEAGSSRPSSSPNTT